MPDTPNLPSFCPMTCGRCNLRSTVVQQRTSLKPYVFAALPYQGIFDDTVEAMRVVVEGGDLFDQNFPSKQFNGNPLKLVEARKEDFVGNGTCMTCQLCWFSDFGVAELATLNPNVLAEVGLLWGFGKPVIFTLHIGYTDIEDVPFDLKNFLLVPYQGIQKLGPDLEDKINYILSIL